jgi:hypothetical protein
LQQLQDTQQCARCTQIESGTSPSCEAVTGSTCTSTTEPVPHGLRQFIGKLRTVLGVDSHSFKSLTHMRSKIDSIYSDSSIGQYTKFRCIPAVCHNCAGFGSLLGCQEAALTRRTSWNRSREGVELGLSGKQLHPATPELTAWQEKPADSSQ